MEPLIKNGLYKHYNNEKIYRLLHESTNPNTGESIIVYRPLRSKKVYHRSKEEFFAKIRTNGSDIPRFKYLEDKLGKRKE